jgi:hypothetical protein
MLRSERAPKDESVEIDDETIEEIEGPGYLQ